MFWLRETIFLESLSCQLASREDSKVARDDLIERMPSNPQRWSKRRVVF